MLKRCIKGVFRRDSVCFGLAVARKHKECEDCYGLLILFFFGKVAELRRETSASLWVGL